MTTAKKSADNRSTATLLILVVLFAIPFFLALVFFNYHTGLGNKTTNNGDLIIPSFSVKKLPITWNNPHRQWTLLLLYPQNCQQQCHQSLYTIRQLRIALGRNRNRLRRMVLIYSPKQQADLQKIIMQDFQGTQIVLTNEKDFQRVIRQQVKQPYALRTGTYYLVDPLGNVMMSYAPNSSPVAMLKDIKKLLKVSQIG